VRSYKLIGGRTIAGTAIIDPRATLEIGVVIHDYVIIERGVTLGQGVEVFPHTVIGRRPRSTGGVVNKAEVGLATETFIGRGSVIGAGVTIYAGCKLDEEVLVGDGTRLRERCLIGPKSIIGSNCTFQNDVEMGMRSRVIDLSHITAGVVIGDDVFISTGVLTMNDNGFNSGHKLEPPLFHDGSSVGGGAVILPGKIIGADAIVAAGSVVTKSVAPRTVVKGVPAR
jgi:acetyltransferase-like isoleucine patch superfamily enzyme